jgi:hypothetical protein
MKTIMTLPEAERILYKVTQHLSYRSSELVQKLVLTKEKQIAIRECLEDAGASCFTLEAMLNLTEHEKSVTYDAINRVLHTKTLQVVFANEYDDEGTAYPMLSIHIAIE